MLRTVLRSITSHFIDTASLCSWWYCRHTEYSFGGGVANRERWSREKYYLSEKLGFLMPPTFITSLTSTDPNLTNQLKPTIFAWNIGVKAIVLHFVVVACMADNGEFTSEGDTATKLVKGRKSHEENANDFWRLCDVNLIEKNSLTFGKAPNTLPREIYLNLQVARSVKTRHKNKQNFPLKLAWTLWRL